MSGFIQSGRFAAGGGFSPTDLTGLVLWLDASDAGSITESGGAVSQWNDLSGNGYHVSQATEAFKPTLSVGAINGLDALNFPDDPTKMSATGVTSLAWKPATVFVVAKINNSATDKTFIAQGDSGYFQFRATSAEKLGLLKSSAVNLGESTTANSTAVASLSVVTYDNSGNYAFFTDRAANGSGTNNQTLTASTNIYVGNRQTAENFLGDIAEILVYDTALGTTDRQAAENYLSAKWGTP